MTAAVTAAVSIALAACAGQKERPTEVDGGATGSPDAAVEIPDLLSDSWETMTDSEKQGFCGDFDARGAEGVREIINDTMGYELVVAEDAEAIFTELCAGV